MVEAQARQRLPQWTLADRLRKSLEHAGVEAADMAEYLEVHPNTIRNWISGRTHPPATAVKLWAMRTGVDYRWIASGIERPVLDDFGPPVDHTLTNPDIPSGISAVTPGGYVNLDHTAIVAEFRKRLPLGRTAHPKIVRTVRS